MLPFWRNAISLGGDINNYVSLAAAFLLLSACAHVDQVGPRAQYWTTEADSFFQRQRSLQAVQSWLRGHNVQYTFTDRDIVDGFWRVQLERIPADGVVCESWHLYLVVAVDESRDVQSHAIEKTDVCL